MSLATEGSLDEQVLRQLLAQVGPHFAPGVCYGKRGRDHLRASLPGFNQAARHQAFLILADLETDDCAPALIQAWLPKGPHRNLMLRIAVRMMESWLLADRVAFSRFLGVSANRLPGNPDDERDPKSLVVGLARRSRFRSIREDLVPALGSTSRVGKNYTGGLTRFVVDQWRAERARQASPSLDRAVRAIARFSPRGID